MGTMVGTPQRIICLCPSLTEAIFDMGAGDRVVGRTDWCVHPDEEVQLLTQVGGTKLVDLEKLFSLDPDLVIVNEEENRIEDVEKIQARGIEILNTFPKTVLQAAQTVRTIGDRIGCEEEAEKIARQIEAERQKTLDEFCNASKFRYIYLIWRRPYMTINDDTFIADLISLVGGENVFANHETRYPKIPVESLREAGPDAIFLPSEPYVFTAPHQAEICAESGLPAERVLLVDGELMSWYGSRTPQGIQYIAKVAKKLREVLK